MSDGPETDLAQELEDAQKQRDEIEREQKELPMIGPVEECAALLPLFARNPLPGFVSGIRNYLCKPPFTGIRRVRGDGNCFYRAVLFGYLDAVVTAMNSKSDNAVTKSFVELQRFKAVIDESKNDLIALGYEELAFETFYDILIELLDSISSMDSTEQLLEKFQEESGESDYYIWYMRLLTAAAMKKNAEQYAPFLTADCADINEYCSRYVEPMKTECEHLQITALTAYLGVQVHIHYLDGETQPDGKLVIHKFQEKAISGEDAEATMYLRLCVHLLYRPGHYDILSVA